MQNRAPSGSGAPQPAQVRVAGTGAGVGAAVGADAGLDPAAAGLGGTPAGADVAGDAAWAEEGALAATPPGVPPATARRLAPQAGQATHVRSSIIFRQFGQRAGANGSAVPQAGQVAASRMIQLPQCGHGCLKAGIVETLLNRSGHRKPGQRRN